MPERSQFARKSTAVPVFMLLIQNTQSVYCLAVHSSMIALEATKMAQDASNYKPIEQVCIGEFMWAKVDMDRYGIEFIQC
jgi:hypothetical protein